MSKKVVILGGGTGGTLVANRLRRELGDDAEITVIDQDDVHVYQPGLLFVPFGQARPEDIVRPRERQLRDGIRYHRSAVRHVNIGASCVSLNDGTVIGYDVLVIATGARLLPEETDGLREAMAQRRAFSFYDLTSATALRDALARFDRGRIVVNVVDMPVKCPVAPLEFCFLADGFYRRHGLRDRVQLTYVTPLDGAFTKPVASRMLSGLLGEKGVEVVTEFNTGEVDGAAGRLVSYDGRTVDYDLAVIVPVHGGAAYVGRSEGLGDELGFVPADPATLQSKASPDIFVIGDAAAVPASKAGSVTHFEGETVARNIARFLDGKPLEAGFDGHANCFIETGSGKAMLIDFNYDTEPLPGHFPGRLGLPLLKQSRLNHLGKLAFSWLYWHSLLPGRDIPGVPSGMPHAGKRLPAAASSGEPGGTGSGRS